jgi:hypothetical protein
MTFREWAEARGYKVRKGDGNPLRGWPYGPDAGEEYVRIRRGWIDDSTGNGGIPMLGIAVFGRKLLQYENIRNKFISRSDEDLILHIPMSDWSDEHERIFEPSRKRSASLAAGIAMAQRNLTPEQRKAIGARLRAARAAKGAVS